MHSLVDHLASGCQDQQWQGLVPKFLKWVNKGHNKQKHLTFTSWLPDQMNPLYGTLHCMYDDR